MKKTPRGIIILHMCTTEGKTTMYIPLVDMGRSGHIVILDHLLIIDNHMMYGSSNK